VIPEINESYLFHGTKTDTVDSILYDGIDNRLGGDRLLFGRGAYFAETATKADQYPGCHLVMYMCIQPNSCTFKRYGTGWAKNRTYLSVDNLATVSGRKACYMSKVLEFCIEKAWNWNVSAFKNYLPDLQKFLPLPLKYVRFFWLTLYFAMN